MVSTRRRCLCLAQFLRGKAFELTSAENLVGSRSLPRRCLMLPTTWSYTSPQRSCFLSTRPWPDDNRMTFPPPTTIFCMPSSVAYTDIPINGIPYYVHSLLLSRPRENHVNILVSCFVIGLQENSWNSFLEGGVMSRTCHTGLHLHPMSCP